MKVDKTGIEITASDKKVFKISGAEVKVKLDAVLGDVTTKKDAATDSIKTDIVGKLGISQISEDNILIDFDPITGEITKLEIGWP